MDELLISGKRYISARRIARDNNYTSDYIGQLIRAGKISGQKVGRAWYVDAASFDAYLVGSEYVPEIVEIEESVTEEVAPAAEEVDEVTEEEIEAPVTASVPVVEQVAATHKKVEAPVMLSVKDDEEVEESQQEEDTEPVRESRYVALTLTQPLHKLTYYDDENPTLPEIRASLSTSRQDEEEFTVLPARKSRSASVASGAWKGRHTVGLLALGMVVFLFAAALSSGVSQNLNVEANNTAAVTYGFNL